MLSKLSVHHKFHYRTLIDNIFANVELRFGVAPDFPEALCVCRETCALFGGVVPAGCGKFLARQLFQRDAALEPSLEPGRLPTEVHMRVATFATPHVEAAGCREQAQAQRCCRRIVVGVAGPAWLRTP